MNESSSHLWVVKLVYVMKQSLIIRCTPRLAVILTHVLSSAWSAFSIYSTMHLDYLYHVLVVGDACEGIDLLPGVWTRRLEIQVWCFLFCSSSKPKIVDITDTNPSAQPGHPFMPNCCFSPFLEGANHSRCDLWAEINEVPRRSSHNGRSKTSENQKNWIGHTRWVAYLFSVVDKLIKLIHALSFFSCSQLSCSC